MNQIIKIILAVLLLLCLAPMPYGYYELVRFVAMAAFAYLAYCHFRAEEEGLGIVDEVGTPVITRTPWIITN